MTIFRWIMGVLAVLFGGGAILSFIIFIAADIELWIRRARKLGRLAWAVCLFWFNVEIWGRVARVLMNWT